MPFTRPSSSSRRSRARPNAQPPTLRRENAEVVYEAVDNAKLSGGVERLLTTFNQTYTGHRVSRAAPAGQIVNDRRIEREPQLPSYTQNPTSGETTMEINPSEELPTYAEASNEQGNSEGDKEEGTVTNYCNQGFH